MIAWHYYALMVADGLMACGGAEGHASSGRDEWRTFSDLMGGGRADQGMKKSVVGIKPNGSCYFFSGERGRKKGREKKEKNLRLTNVRRPSGAVSSSLVPFRCNE